MITRRKLLISGAVLAAIAAVPLSSGLRSWLRAQLADEFGDEIAAQAMAEGFGDDYLASLRQMRFRDYLLASVYFRLKPQSLVLMAGSEADIRRHMIGVFLRSSNVILTVERGDAFAYEGLFLPEVYPCSNQLGGHVL